MKREFGDGDEEQKAEDIGDTIEIREIGSNPSSSNTIHILKRQRIGNELEVIKEKSIWDMTDVEIIIDNIINFTVDNKFPFVFYHQIFHELSGDRSIVQQDLILLRESKTHKLLHYGHLVDKEGQFFRKGLNNRCEPIVLVPTDYYLQTCLSFLKNPNRESDPNFVNLQQKIRNFVTQNLQLSIAKSNLMSNPNDFTEEEIELLVTSGFLMPREHINSSSSSSTKSSTHVGFSFEEVYWISHPILGRVMQFVREVQRKILDLLKRKKYKEVYERELHKIFMQDNSFLNTQAKGSVKVVSIFSLRYHLLDLQARNLITKNTTPNEKDVIVRLVQ